MKKIGNILWGLALIVVGIIFALNAFGITDINLFFKGWWTLFIIVPCFIGLFKETEKMGSMIGLIIGVALLLCSQDILSFDTIWKLMAPAILVIIGISLIFKDSFGKKISEDIKKTNNFKSHGEADSYSAIFAGQELNFENQEVSELDLTAVFGGIDCSLKNAKIISDTEINAISVFGGIDIIVPANVEVKIKSVPIFGGVSNKAPQKKDENSHTIYINAVCIFGGVEIK